MGNQVEQNNVDSSIFIKVFKKRGGKRAIIHSVIGHAESVFILRFIKYLEVNTNLSDSDAR